MRRPRTPSTLPTKGELLNAIDEAERALTEMIGRWEDGIPGVIRDEIRKATAPLLKLLIQAHRR